MAGKKSAAARGPTALSKYRGTGFEEFYADPPMTAAEANEEREKIYNPTFPFVDRIQACIQRFRCRRRIGGAEGIRFFNQYLFLGGVDTSARLFGGNTEQDVQDMTPDERRTATATDVVYSSGGGSKFYSADDPEGWDVDFAGVVAGFCSENLPPSTNWDYLRMGKAIGIIENFLTYVLQHDVCPEYESNVKEALAVCDKAKTDLPLTHQALIRFPGQFNSALSRLFCADFHYFYHDDDAYLKRPDVLNPAAVVKVALAVGVLHMGVDKEKAAIIIRAVDSIQTGSKDNEAKDMDIVQVTHEEDCNMEIVEIHRISHVLREVIGGICVDGTTMNDFTAMGKLVLKPCVIHDGYDDGSQNDSSGKGSPHTFLVDDDILGRLRPGFKMQLRLTHLNNGVTFIRQVRSVFVAWHTFLPQNLMMHFKEPVADDHPAPSAKNHVNEQYDEAPEASFGNN